MQTTLSVGPDVAQFIASGGRDVELARLAKPTPEAPAQVDGAHHDVIDEQRRPLGRGVLDVAAGRLRMYVSPRDGFARIDAALVGWRVEHALALRLSLGLLQPDACYRLLNGAADGLPGYCCDVLGDYAVLYVYSPALMPLAPAVADAVRGFAKVRGVVVKLRLRGGASDVQQQVVGHEPPAAYTAHECGIPVEIHPLGGLNVGLFTDMRQERWNVAKWALGKRVLNLFSYTGMLGLACAHAGAASVVNVDTSEGVHAWARSNFSRSGLTPGSRYRFDLGDAGRFLARAKRDKETYDLILIDPPTQSVAAGTPWNLTRDYPQLIAAATQCLAPGGLLWLAANTHGLSSLVKLASRAVAQETKRELVLLHEGGLPADYPTVPVQPWDRYLQVAAFVAR